MFSIIEVLGAVAPRGEAPPRGGLYLIKSLRVRSVRGRCCGSEDASGDDVNILIIIGFHIIILVIMALCEVSWASDFRSSALSHFGACRGPYLIAEGAVAVVVGIDDGCPNPGRSSKQQFACLALGRWFGNCLTNRRSHCHVGREGAVADGRLA